MLNEWKAATEFPKLLSLSRRFLTRDPTIPNTPYQSRLDDGQLIPDLLRLHGFGLFTIESGRYYHEFSSHESQINEFMQRPYVTFCLEGNHYENLFTKLQQTTEIVVAAQKVSPFKLLHGSESDNGVHIRNRNRQGNTIESLEDEDWWDFQFCDVNMPLWCKEFGVDSAEITVFFVLARDVYPTHLQCRKG